MVITFPSIYLYFTQDCFLNRSVTDNLHFVGFVFLRERERHFVLGYFHHIKTVHAPFFSQMYSKIPLARGSRYVGFRGDEPVLHIKINLGCYRIVLNIANKLVRSKSITSACIHESMELCPCSIE